MYKVRASVRVAVLLPQVPCGITEGVPGGTYAPNEGGKHLPVLLSGDSRIDKRRSIAGKEKVVPV